MSGRLGLRQVLRTEVEQIGLGTGGKNTGLNRLPRWRQPVRRVPCRFSITSSHDADIEIALDALLPTSLSRHHPHSSGSPHAPSGTPVAKTLMQYDCNDNELLLESLAGGGLRLPPEMHKLLRGLRPRLHGRTLITAPPTKPWHVGDASVFRQPDDVMTGTSGIPALASAEASSFVEAAGTATVHRPCHRAREEASVSQIDRASAENAKAVSRDLVMAGTPLAAQFRSILSHDDDDEDHPPPGRSGQTLFESKSSVSALRFPSSDSGLARALRWRLQTASLPGDLRDRHSQESLESAAPWLESMRQLRMNSAAGKLSALPSLESLHSLSQPSVPSLSGRSAAESATFDLVSVASGRQRTLLESRAQDAGNQTAQLVSQELDRQRTRRALGTAAPPWRPLASDATDSSAGATAAATAARGYSALQLYRQACLISGITPAPALLGSLTDRGALRVAAGRVSDAEVAPLSAALADGSVPFVSVDLSGSGLSDWGVACIADALAVNPGIVDFRAHCLMLSQPGHLASRAPHAILRLLAASTTIALLSLEDNSLGDEFIRCLHHVLCPRRGRDATLAPVDSLRERTTFDEAQADDERRQRKAGRRVSIGALGLGIPPPGMGPTAQQGKHGTGKPQMPPVALGGTGKQQRLPIQPVRATVSTASSRRSSLEMGGPAAATLTSTLAASFPSTGRGSFSRGQPAGLVPFSLERGSSQGPKTQARLTRAAATRAALSSLSRTLHTAATTSAASRAASVLLSQSRSLSVLRHRSETAAAAAAAALGSQQTMHSQFDGTDFMTPLDPAVSLAAGSMMSAGINLLHPANFGSSALAARLSAGGHAPAPAPAGAASSILRGHAPAPPPPPRRSKPAGAKDSFTGGGEGEAQARGATIPPLPPSAPDQSSSRVIPSTGDSRTRSMAEASPLRPCRGWGGANGGAAGGTGTDLALRSSGHRLPALQPVGPIEYASAHMQGQEAFGVELSGLLLLSQRSESDGESVRLALSGRRHSVRSMLNSGADAALSGLESRRAKRSSSGSRWGGAEGLPRAIGSEEDLEAMLQLAPRNRALGSTTPRSTEGSITGNGEGDRSSRSDSRLSSSSDVTLDQTDPQDEVDAKGRNLSFQARVSRHAQRHKPTGDGTSRRGSGVDPAGCTSSRSRCGAATESTGDYRADESREGQEGAVYAVVRLLAQPSQQLALRQATLAVLDRGRDAAINAHAQVRIPDAFISAGGAPVSAASSSRLQPQRRFSGKPPLRSWDQRTDTRVIRQSLLAASDHEQTDRPRVPSFEEYAGEDGVAVGGTSPHARLDDSDPSGIGTSSSGATVASQDGIRMVAPAGTKLHTRHGHAISPVRRQHGSVGDLRPASPRSSGDADWNPSFSNLRQRDLRVSIRRLALDDPAAHASPPPTLRLPELPQALPSVPRQFVVNPAGCRTLRTLNLRNNPRITAESGPVLAAMIGREEDERNAVPASGITSLLLGGASLGSEGALPLLKAVVLPPQHLTELDISHCGMDDAVAPALRRALASSVALLRLDVSHNRLGPVAALALGEGIGASATIERLDASHNPLGTKAAMELLLGVAANPSLEWLGLAAIASTADDTTIKIRDLLPAGVHIGKPARAAAAGVPAPTSPVAAQEEELDRHEERGMAADPEERGGGPSTRKRGSQSMLQAMVNRVYWINKARSPFLLCYFGRVEDTKLQFDGTFDREALEHATGEPGKQGRRASAFGAQVWGPELSMVASRVRDADSESLWDTLEVCQGAFDNDIGNCRMVKLVGAGPAAARAVRVLRLAFPLLREGFRAWGLSHPADSPFDVSYSELRSMWTDLGLDRAVPRKRRFHANEQVSLAFVSSNYDEKGDTTFNPADALVRHEYIEIVTRLAFIVQGPDNTADARADCVAQFLSSSLLPPLRRLLSWHACTLHTVAGALDMVQLVGPTQWTKSRARRMQAVNTAAAEAMRLKRAAGLAKLVALSGISPLSSPGGSGQGGTVGLSALSPAASRQQRKHWSRQTSDDLNVLRHPDAAAVRSIALARKASKRRMAHKVTGDAAGAAGAAPATDDDGPPTSSSLFHTMTEVANTGSAVSGQPSGRQRSNSDSGPSLEAAADAHGVRSPFSRADAPTPSGTAQVPTQTLPSAVDPAAGRPGSSDLPAASPGDPDEEYAGLMRVGLKSLRKMPSLARIDAKSKPGQEERREAAKQLFRQMQVLDKNMPVLAREAEALVARRILRPDEVAVPGMYRVGISSTWSASAETARRGLAAVVQDVDARQEAAVPVTAVLQARGHLRRLDWLRLVGAWRSNTEASCGLSPPPALDEWEKRAQGAAATETVALARTDKAAAMIAMQTPTYSLFQATEEVVAVSRVSTSTDPDEDGEMVTKVLRQVESVAMQEGSGAMEEAPAREGAGFGTQSRTTSAGLAAKAATGPAPPSSGSSPGTVSHAGGSHGSISASRSAVASAEAATASRASPLSAESLFAAAASLVKLRARKDDASAWIHDPLTGRKLPTAVSFAPEALTRGELDLVSNAFRRLWLVREDVDRVLARHMGALQRTYSAYSGRMSRPGARRHWMSWHEWMEMAADCGIVPHFASDRVASAAFVWSAATQLDEAAGLADSTGKTDSPDSHSFAEYIESLARLAAAGEGMGSYGLESKRAVLQVAHGMRRDDSRRRHRAAILTERRRKALQNKRKPKATRDAAASSIASSSDHSSARGRFGQGQGDNMAGTDAWDAATRPIRPETDTEIHSAQTGVQALQLPAGTSRVRPGAGRLVDIRGKRAIVAPAAARFRDRVDRAKEAARTPPREDDTSAMAKAEAALGPYGSGMRDVLLFDIEDDPQRRVLVDYLCRLDFLCRALDARGIGGAPTVAAQDG